MNNNRLDKSELFINNDLYFKIFVANMTFWSLTDQVRCLFAFSAVEESHPC